MSERGATALLGARWPRPTLTRWLFLAGVALFAWLIWRVGAAPIGHLLLGVGWKAVLLPLPHILITLSETTGWWFAFSRDGCPKRLATLLRFTVASRAIQGVTPSVSQATELVRIHLLRQAGVRPDLATASVVTAKTTASVSELTFIVLGLTALLGSVAIDPAAAAWAVGGVGVLALVLAGFLTWQRLGFFRPIVWLGSRLAILRAFLDRHGPLLSSTEAMLREYLVRHRARFWASGLAYLTAWLVAVCETWMFLRIIGQPAHFTVSLIILAWVALVTRLTAFVPAGLGTQEAGTLMAFAFVGLPPEGALAFALLRRFRQLVWMAVGLAILSRESRRR
jgi:uncharacterized protein (TIRG00374 family)